MNYIEVVYTLIGWDQNHVLRAWIFTSGLFINPERHER